MSASQPRKLKEILHAAQNRAKTPASETRLVQPHAQTGNSAATHALPQRAEYRILEGPNGIAELELRVNDMLDQGWKLIGGLCFDRGCAYQAMARVTTEPMEPRVPPPTLGES